MYAPKTEQDFLGTLSLSELPTALGGWEYTLDRGSYYTSAYWLHICLPASVLYSPKVTEYILHFRGQLQLNVMII